MAVFTVLYLLVFAIFALVGYAILQIKLFGMNVKDFWGFIEANQILDRLYNYAKYYEKMSTQEQLIYLMEAEKVFNAFEKVPGGLWEEEYDVVYVSRSNRLSLRFDISNDDNTVMVFFMTYEEEYPFEGYTTYPKEEIDKTYPLGVRDVLPQFSYQGVTY